MLVAGTATTAIGAESTAAPNPLLDLLIQKGFVTKQEAEKVQAEAEAIRTNGVTPIPESKWKISNGIKSVELFGDIRLRYENRRVEDPNGGSIDLQRERYDLRVGLRGELLDNYYYGFRLETSTNPRSSWVTFGNSSSAPFGKTGAGINIGQIYLGWKRADWVELTIGKMPNPFYTTSMVWDGDLNPEGLAEHFKHSVGKADLFANFGQFVYQDTNPNQASTGYFNLGYNNANTPFLLGWQAGVNYHFTQKVSFKVAPAVYNYTGYGANNINVHSPDFSGTFVGQGSKIGVNANSAFYNLGPYNGFFSNETGINNLMILEIPWELNFKMDKLSLRFFGDYAQNLEGSNRAKAAYAAQQSPLFDGTGIILIPSAQTSDTKAYQVGFALGNKDSLGLVNGATSRKNAWEFRSYYQHVEQYALDPNLLDSDFFEGRGNLEGVYAAIAYGLSDNIIGTVRYGYATRINDKLGTGGSNQDIPQMNPIEHYNLFQLDVTYRF